MKEERLMILKMIEDGKINADDGVKLLNALNGEGQNFKKAELEEKLSKAAKTVDAFAKDVKVKVEAFAKDAEPKVKEASQVVLEKTAVAFDELGKALKNVFETNTKDDCEDVKDVENEAEDFDVVVEDKTKEE